MKLASCPHTMPLSSTRSELLKKRLDQFTRVLSAVEQGEVRGLHRARVASRRLRELLPMLQLEHDKSRKLSRRLRKVTRRLGAVRELDVLLLLVEELHVARRGRSGSLGRVGISVAKDRDDARKRLEARLPIDRMRRLGEKLTGVVEELRTVETSPSRAVARNWPAAVDAQVAARAARLAAAVTAAGAMYLPERLHNVRIAVKKVRYALELSNELAGTRRDPNLMALKRGQELLGRMHDLQVLVERVRQVQASLTPPNVTIWRNLDALVASLEDECRVLHARYMRMRDRLMAVAEALSARTTPGAAAGNGLSRRAG
jgi:CHAD domain-containing protein